MDMNPAMTFVTSIMATSQMSSMTQPVITQQVATEKERTLSERSNRRRQAIMDLGIAEDLTNPAKRDAAITALEAYLKVIEG